MNRIDFLHTLYLELDGMPEAARRAMLAPFEASFRDGLGEGRSEADIAQQLGDPAEIARRLKTAQSDGRSGSTGDIPPNNWQNGPGAPPPNNWQNGPGAPPPNGWQNGPGAPPPNGWNGNAGGPPPGWRPNRRGCLSSCLVGCVILLLNLCFVLGPVLAVYGLLFGGWCMSLGFSLGGVAAFVGSLVVSTLPGWVPDSLSMATLLSGSVLMASAGLLLVMGLWHVTRWTFRLTGRYAKWTTDLIFNRSA